MLPVRSGTFLSSAERQLFHQKGQKSGQCLRCFHASRRFLVDQSSPDPSGNSKGTPYNTPQRGPTRQQRAAKVSSEVSALAADLPISNLAGRNAEVQNAQPQNPEVSPQAQGKNVRPGAMGETDGPGREGPFAQGVGRVERNYDEPPNVSKEARGVRTPKGKLEDPTEGGEGVMAPLASASPSAQVAETSQPSAGTVEASPARPASRGRQHRSRQISTPARKSWTAEDYLSLGQNGATIASSNYAGVLRDRINLLAPPNSVSHDSTRALEYRLVTRGNRLTALRSQKQKSLIRDSAAQIAEKRAERKGLDQRPLKGHPRFKQFGENKAQSVIDRLVLGRYDPQGLLSGEKVHKQPMLNEVAILTLKNSTYLSRDSDRLLNKVRSLLPVAPAAGSGKKQRQPASR